MNIKSANDLVNEALLEIKTISAEEALESFRKDKINLIIKDSSFSLVIIKTAFLKLYLYLF